MISYVTIKGQTPEYEQRLNPHPSTRFAVSTDFLFGTGKYMRTVYAPISELTGKKKRIL